MSDELELPEDPEAIPAFEEYESSLGTVVGHEEGSYHIRTADGRVIGIPANGEPSAEAVEDDIATPPVIPVPVPQSLTPRQFWRALYDQLGLTRDAILSMVGEDPVAKIDILASSEFLRDYPLLPILAAHPDINVGSAQIDDLFRYGVTIA